MFLYLFAFYLVLHIIKMNGKILIMKMCSLVITTLNSKYVTSQERAHKDKPNFMAQSLQWNFVLFLEQGACVWILHQVLHLWELSLSLPSLLRFQRGHWGGRQASHSLFRCCSWCSDNPSWPHHAGNPLQGPCASLLGPTRSDSHHCPGCPVYLLLQQRGQHFWSVFFKYCQENRALFP